MAAVTHSRFCRSMWSGCLVRSPWTSASVQQPRLPLHQPTAARAPCLLLSSHFSAGSPRSGPGADRHYKSEKEREEEDDAKRKAKRKKILFGGLGVGIVLGGALGYMSSQSSKKGQISNDNFV